MQTRELDRLFDRYRREGDVEALAAVFDATSKELFVVARHLARDTAEAEDLVQETYLGAIERAWSYDSELPLVPWLVGITTIAARRKRRLAARTIDAERLPQRAPDDPERALASRELDEALHGALEELPAKYRSVLELHLEHGRKPAEIAHELALAPGNVRVQLHRGLELLRRALPPSLALGALAPSVDPRWFERVRGDVLARAEAAASGLASEGLELSRETVSSGARETTRATARSVSRASATKSVIVAVAALLPIVAGWSWLARRGDGAHGERNVSESTLARADSAPASAAAQAPLELDRESSSERNPATPAISAEATTVLVIHVSGLERDARGVIKLVARLANTHGPALTAQLAPSATLSVDASTLYADSASNELLFVQLDHPDYLPAEVSTAAPDPNDRSRPRVINAWAHFTRAIASVRGRVTGVTSAEPPNAFTTAPSGGGLTTITVVRKGAVQPSSAVPVLVGLFRMKPDGVPETMPTEAEFAALDGSFELRTENEGEHLLAISARERKTEARRVSIHEHDLIELGDIALTDGETLSGHVTGVADARVNCDARGSGYVNLLGALLTYCDGELESAQTATIDAHGRFRFDHLVARPHRLTPWASPAPTHRNDAFSRARLEVYDRARHVDATPPAADVELTLRELELLLEIAADSGPAHGARIEIAHHGQMFSGGHTDDNGRIVLEVHAREPFSVQIQGGETASRDIELDPNTLVDGQVMQLELSGSAHGTRLRFDVDDPTSLRVNLTPLEGLDADARARVLQGIFLDREPRMMMRRLDERGELAERLPSGHWAVDLRPAHEFPDAGDEYRLPARFELELGGEAERRIPVQLELGGRLLLRAGDFVGRDARVQCELVDAHDALTRVRFARRTLDASGHASMNGQSMLDLAGPSFTSVLPAGTYRLRVSGEHVATHETQVTVASARTSEIELGLQTR